MSHARVNACSKWITCFAVGAALAASPAGAADSTKPAAPAKTPAPTTLSGIGLSLEEALLAPLEGRRGAVESAADALAAFTRGDVPKDKRGAVSFLSGEISYALGDYERSAEEFKNAAKRDDKGPFADDAAFAAIRSLEAAGRDVDAVKAWKDWEKKYPRSPLAGEALVARSWNALRRGAPGEAARLLETLAERHRWMENDPRVVLARSVVAYLEGRPGDVVTALREAPDGPAATYLRAMAFEAQGASLKAAALYQEVAERYPRSTLHDPAMLAKANIFLATGAYRSAAEEMQRVIERCSRDDIRGEAEIRRAMAIYLDGKTEEGFQQLRDVAAKHDHTDIAARAHYFLGEALFAEKSYPEAIAEFNRVLADYFEHSLAARAQYRVGRCLDALGRGAEATSTYQATVAGYPLSPESPAAAYLAGVGLIAQKRPLAAAPYFQLVLDRYAKNDSSGAIVFASEDHRELVEASLCLLEYSYHLSGNLGQLSGVPHLMLQKMPPSTSPWRAYALLIDADALAAQGRFAEAEGVLKGLIASFPESPVAIPANRLLAWTYAEQGQGNLAIETEERMLSKYAAFGDEANLSSAFYNKANILFNRKEYKEAAATYDEYLRRFPRHPKRLQALYQAGLCYQRLDQNGDAVDRWEALVKADSASALAERALVRAGDLYFRAESYADAKRCYGMLLERFSSSSAAAMGLLRIAQCEYNAGNDEEALNRFSEVASRFPESPVVKDAERGIELALYRLGQSADGSEVLERLVEKYPTSAFAADAQFEIAMRSYKAKNYAEAAEEFRRVVSQFPGYSAADRAHYLMADSYREAGASRDAFLAYEQFLSLFPESEFRPTIRFRLGSMRFEEGKYLEAAVDFTDVTDGAAPKDIAAASLYNLALCKRMIGDGEGAARSLVLYRERYSASDERAADIAYQLGDIYDKAGRADEAAGEFARALAAKPEARLAIELHYRLGYCAEQGKDDERAISEYRKAYAAEEKDDDYRLLAVARLAALHEKRGDNGKALAAYRDLIKNSKDEELVLAAKEHAELLKSASK
jgi:TolA-binding protein